VRAIAAAQTVPIRGDVDANLEEHVRLARAAAREGVHVLVFPELSLTGYELDLAESLAFSERDARLAPLSDLASAHAITLVAGAPVRIGSRLHLGAFILAPDRTVELYTKHHLGAFGESARVDGTVPPPERTFFHPGDRDPLLRFGGHTAAVAICADTGRPTHPQAAANRGADTYLASMFVIPSDFSGDMENLASYAQRHAMAVVFANFGGASGGLASAGASAIWSPRGEQLARLGASGAGIVVASEGAAGWRAKAVTA
jgi:predicted amidohydrolase